MFVHKVCFTLALPHFSAMLMKVCIDRVCNAHVLLSSDVGINLGFFLLTKNMMSQYTHAFILLGMHSTSLEL